MQRIVWAALRFMTADITLENARVLVQAGATLAIKDSPGETPYKRARDWKSKEIAKYQLSPEEQADEISPPPYWGEKKYTPWILELQHPDTRFGDVLIQIIFFQTVNVAAHPAYRGTGMMGEGSLGFIHIEGDIFQ